MAAPAGPRLRGAHGFVPCPYGSIRSTACRGGCGCSATSLLSLRSTFHRLDQVECPARGDLRLTTPGLEHLVLAGPPQDPARQRQPQPAAPTGIPGRGGRGLPKIQRPSERSVEASHLGILFGRGLPGLSGGVTPADVPTLKEGCDREG